MKVFKVDNRQQKMIEAFFKEELSNDQNAPMFLYAAGILVFVSMILLLVPFRAWEDDGGYLAVMGYFIFAGGLGINTAKYKTRNVNNTNQYVSFSSIMRYLPVEPFQLVIFRIRKNIKPCVICMSISLVFRCLISYAAYGTLSIWDMVLPVAGMLIIPVFNGF